MDQTLRPSHMLHPEQRTVLLLSDVMALRLLLVKARVDVAAYVADLPHAEAGAVPVRVEVA